MALLLTDIIKRLGSTSPFVATSQGPSYLYTIKDVMLYTCGAEAATLLPRFDSLKGRAGMKSLSFRTLLFGVCGVCLVTLFALGIGLFHPALVSSQRLTLEVVSSILLAVGIAIWAVTIWLGGNQRHAGEKP
jgi:hypothetical protein